MKFLFAFLLLASTAMADARSIYVVNRATIPLQTGAATADVLVALQTQANDVCKVWSLPAVKLQLADVVPDGEWGIGIVDDGVYAGILGWHDTQKGVPRCVVYAKVAKHYGVVPSSVVSHELVEMLVNPGADKSVALPKGDKRGQRIYLETADPCQNFTYSIQGNKKWVTVSDWVTPAWFGQPSLKSKLMDKLNQLKKPFQISNGGYALVWDGKSWIQHRGPQTAPVKPTLSKRIDKRD